MTDIKFVLEKLDGAICSDPFECLFDMYGKNKKGHYGCFAKFPNGDPNEQNHGCIAAQAADIIRELTGEGEG